MRIKAVKVIITMLAKESLNMNRPSIRIKVPWKMDFHNQMQKVLTFMERPFYIVLYKGGKLMIEFTSASSSKTRENTGRDV